MAENSSIEWTDHTFNPWRICTPVSPGCANCYAAALAKRTGIGEYRKGVPRIRTSEANWKLPLKWNRDAEQTTAAIKADIGNASEYQDAGYERPRVFCASLADWLDDEVPSAWLADLLALIYDTPHLDWLLLTKRPENWRKRVGDWGKYWGPTNGQFLAYDWCHGKPPANVWVGTTVEDQARADERIPRLLQIPAKVRFLSCEPLLGPVKLPIEYEICRRTGLKNYPFNLPEAHRTKTIDGIHWVIAGGESGPNARPMHSDWARSLRDQCQAAGVPFLFKQWGEYAPGWIDGKPHHGFVDATFASRVGKKAAGRLLDGREWNEFPSV